MTQPVDRERAALQAILDALLPQLVYFSVWAYRVTGTSGTGPVTISAKSQDPRVPDLSSIVLRPGPDGGYSTPPNGSEVAIGFLNGDPERPYVHSLDPTATSDNAWLPITTKTKIAGGGPKSARRGDTVDCGYLVLTSTGTVVSYFPGDLPPSTSNFDAATTAANKISGSVISMTGGVIITGSSKVEVGP